MRDLQNLQIGARLIVPRHTPQPWEFWQGSDGAFVIHKRQTHIICQRGGYDEPEKVIEAAANARLFFAAPKMFALLGVTYHALQSYAHGNSAPALAAGVAELVGGVLIEATEGPHA